MLNVLSFFFITRHLFIELLYPWVSMLNVLSFFFIKIALYLNIYVWKTVSMLKVLSFFFISSDNGKCYHLLQEVSMLNVLSFLFIYYKNGKDNLRKFRRSTFWAFSLCVLPVREEIKQAGFDAQRFELFLYEHTTRSIRLYIQTVSMLNVLSFFFIRYKK